jgi:excinuclease ABC subunit A
MSGYTSVAVMYFSALAEHYHFSLDTPFEQLSKEAQNAVLFGTKGVKMKVNRAREFGGGAYYTSFEGVVNNLERRDRDTSSDWSKADIESVMSTEPCTACKGARLCPESLAVTVGGRNIDEISRLSVVAALDFCDHLALNKREHLIGDLILKEVRERLGFLKSVGLDYLTLSRSSATLSGGESQRIRLATQIGSSLMGVL